MGIKEMEKGADVEKPKERSVWLSNLLLLAIALARISCGLFLSISGPTLPSLALNCNVSVGVIGWLFTARSAGVLLGAIITPIMMKKCNNLLFFGLATLLISFVITATPWITYFWLLSIVVLLGGIAFGYLDSGMRFLGMTKLISSVARP